MTPHMPRAALTIALTGALIGGAAFAAPTQALPSGRAQAAAPSAPASSAPASSTPPASALKPAVGATTDQNGFEIDANGVLLRYTGSASDITIPGKATAIADEALRGTTAERITVPATVRTIGDRAFADAQQLKALVFEDTADHPSQLTAIGAEAAANTPALTEVAVPSKTASLGEGAFASSGITRLSLPDSLTSIPARLVKNSSLLTEAVVGNAVTEIGEAAFSAAHSLKGLSVRQAGGSTAPGFPSSLVTIGQEAFNATGLGSVDLPASVRTIGDAAFNAIERLSHVGLNEGLVSIGSSAFRTTGITEIVIPDSVTTVGSSAFSECSALTSAHIGRGVEAGQLSDAFTSSRQLSGFTVAPDNASYEAVDGVLYSKDHTSLVVYPAGKGSGTTYTVLDETTRIESGAFNSAPLKGVVLPSSLRSIGDWAFSGSYLESLVLPKAFETFGECAFSGMPSLARVDLGGTKTIGEQAFLASHALQEVDFRADLGRLTTISAYAFAETGLVSAVLPDSVTSLGDGAFTRSTDLKEVHLGSGLTELGARVFTGTTALASLSVDPTNPVLSLDGSVLYQQGNDGSHLVYAALAAPLPAYSVRPGTAQIDEAAFKGHATLREVVVPEGVKAIGAQAFAGIHELTDVALPDSLEEVSDAFAGTQVETIEFGARIRTIEEAAFDGGLPVLVVLHQLIEQPARRRRGRQQSCDRGVLRGDCDGPQRHLEETGVEGPNVHGSHQTIDGSGLPVGQGVGLGAGGDVGGNAAQRTGDGLERPRPGGQRIQSLKSDGLLQIEARQDRVRDAGWGYRWRRRLIHFSDHVGNKGSRVIQGACRRGEAAGQGVEVGRVHGDGAAPHHHRGAHTPHGPGVAAILWGGRGGRSRGLRGCR